MMKLMFKINKILIKIKTMIKIYSKPLITYVVICYCNINKYESMMKKFIDNIYMLRITEEYIEAYDEFDRLIFKQEIQDVIKL